MVRTRGTTEEELEEWFLRLDFGVQDTTDIASLQGFMKRRADFDGFPPPTGDQVNALWNHIEGRYQWAEASIAPFLSRTTIGPPLRFGIKGFRGAFGITKARWAYEVRMSKPAPF